MKGPQRFTWLTQKKLSLAASHSCGAAGSKVRSHYHALSRQHPGVAVSIPEISGLTASRASSVAVTLSRIPDFIDLCGWVSLYRFLNSQTCFLARLDQQPLFFRPRFSAPAGEWPFWHTVYRTIDTTNGCAFTCFVCMPEGHYGTRGIPLLMGAFTGMFVYKIPFSLRGVMP